MMAIRGRLGIHRFYLKYNLLREVLRNRLGNRKFSKNFDVKELALRIYLKKHMLITVSYL